MHINSQGNICVFILVTVYSLDTTLCPFWLSRGHLQHWEQNGYHGNEQSCRKLKGKIFVHFSTFQTERRFTEGGEARRSPSSDVKGSHVLLISSKHSDWLLPHIKALHESGTILTPVFGFCLCCCAYQWDSALTCGSVNKFSKNTQYQLVHLDSF